MAKKSQQRHPQVINLDEARVMERNKGKNFGSKFAFLGGSTGSSALGCNLFEVAPGRSAFPHHYHCAIEEALFILEGEGKLRIGETVVTVRSGDWVSLPAGPEHAHRLDNHTHEPLRYLCVSNRAVADIVGYPDSKKVMARAVPGNDFASKPWVMGIFQDGTGVDYYEGEDCGGEDG